MHGPLNAARIEDTMLPLLVPRIRSPHRPRPYRPALEALEGRALPSAGVTEFPVPTPGSGPVGITAGPDGNLWFTENAANQVGRITPAGAVREFPILTSGSDPAGITAGPDGNLWFTEFFGNKIGTMSPAGSLLAETPILTTNGNPAGITAGPDGNLWFTEAQGGRIGRITPAGAVSEFALAAGSRPTAIAVGPDGHLWFTEAGADRVGRISTAGVVTSEFLIPTANSDPEGIAAGPDGALWFTETAGNHIGRISTGGTISEFAVPTAGSSPQRIALGPEGNLWFTEAAGGQVGRITPAGSVTEFGGLSAGSAPQGITAGPGGTLWFAEQDAGRVARLVPDQPLTVTGTMPVATAGRAVRDVLATFTDADPAAAAGDFTATVIWGDGRTSPGTVVAEGGAAFAVQGAHAYALPGRYTVTVTVTDGDTGHDVGGSTAAATTQAVVGTHNERFVAQAFLDLVGRPVDPARLASYARLLGQGTSRAAVVLQMEQLPAYRVERVRELYRGLMGEAATEAQLNGALRFLAGGGTFGQLETRVLGSAAYFQTRGGGSDAGFLAALAQDLWHQPLDAVTAAQLSGLLARGASRMEIALDLMRTGQAARATVQGLYQRFLRRPASPTELAAQVRRLHRGLSAEQLVADLVGSAEYFQRL
jgi:streptogramin lyase